MKLVMSETPNPMSPKISTAVTPAAPARATDARTEAKSS